MNRVEFVFGAASVGPHAWSRFLATIVTPRFPNGFTVLEGRGQWRGPHGIQAERSRVLIVYYQADAKSERAIEVIREAYKARFAQLSVLKAESLACVDF